MQNNSNKIRILTVEDHPVFRDGIINLVKNEKDMEIAGQTPNGIEAVELACKIKPDIILMDISLEGQNGFKAIKQIRNKTNDICIIVLSGSSDIEYIIQALAVGANGYISKEYAGKELIPAIRKVLKGETYFDEKVRELIKNNPDLIGDLVPGYQK